MQDINESASQMQDIDLSISEGMNAYQQAHFLQVQPSCTAESEFDKMMPDLYYPPGKDCALYEKTSENYEHFFTDFKLSEQVSLPVQVDRKSSQNEEHVPSRRQRKPKGKNKRDYDKNICGYITKKVVREFLGGSYPREIKKLLEKYDSTWEQCKSYYGKKVENITGPSHLPELFFLTAEEDETLGGCKKVFRDFYGWFLQYRYLRYLLLEGKMVNKLAYIEYKNANLFKYVEERCYDFGKGKS